MDLRVAALARVSVAAAVAIRAPYLACMARYPTEYDSSGEVQSIEFHGHEANAPKLPHQDVNFPLPSGLTITWKDGHRDRVVQLEILGIGAARIVLQGVDEFSSTKSPYVFKLQGWGWHDTSNGDEHWIVSEYMSDFAPRFFMAL